MDPDVGVPDELASDAWVIRRNALRLLSALSAFVDRFGEPRDSNRLCRIEARIEHGVPADAVGLTAIDGVGAGRARKLASAGIRSPADVRAAGVDGLVEAGLSAGVAERVHENAGALPVIEIDWGTFPDSIGRGDRDFREVSVGTAAGRARAAVRVTVNGVEMTTTSGYVDPEIAVPVGVFGAAGNGDLAFAVEVTFPDLPLPPVAETRSVRVS